MFHDACGQDDRIDASEDSSIRSDIFGERVDIHLYRESAFLISFLDSCKDIPHVAGSAGNAQQSAFLVQEIFDLLHLHLVMRNQVRDHCRIDIAGSRAHHRSFERCHAHGGLYDLSVLDSGYADAVADMTGDDLGIFSSFHEPIIDVIMRRPMESVSPDLILGIIGIRYRIKIMRRFHALMECRIEDGNLFHLRQQFLASKDGLQIRRIV